MNFVDEIAKQMANDIDNAIFKFLNNNGYEINNINNLKRLKEIMQELKEKDLFIDCIEYALPHEIENASQLKITKFICPFFNCISHPINKDEMLKTLQEMYDRGELDYARN